MFTWIFGNQCENNDGSSLLLEGGFSFFSINEICILKEKLSFQYSDFKPETM